MFNQTNISSRLNSFVKKIFSKMSSELKSDSENSEKNQSDAPLFPIAPGKTKPDYGTNNTLELLERIPSKVVELKLDEVVTAVKAVDNLCDYPKCKARTSLMGQDCALCKSRFCFKHCQPEVHGCTEAARKHERELFMHPKPLKTVRQEQELVQAKKKLQGKLKEMQFERKQKQPTQGGAADGKQPSNSGASSGGAGGGGARKKKGK